MSELVVTRDNWEAAEAYADEVISAVSHAWGAMAVEECRRDCPVSDNTDPAHTHMIDTIAYEVVDTPGGTTTVVSVSKHYASYVDQGTSRMAPRPFFTNGMQRAEDGYETLVRQVAGTGRVLPPAEGGASISAGVSGRGAEARGGGFTPPTSLAEPAPAGSPLRDRLRRRRGGA